MAIRPIEEKVAAILWARMPLFPTQLKNQLRALLSAVLQKLQRCFDCLVSQAVGGGGHRGGFFIQAACQG
jgi:hypothetical protein